MSGIVSHVQETDYLSQKHMTKLGENTVKTNEDLLFKETILSDPRELWAMHPRDSVRGEAWNLELLKVPPGDSDLQSGIGNIGITNYLFNQDNL